MRKDIETVAKATAEAASLNGKRNHFCRVSRERFAT